MGDGGLLSLPDTCQSVAPRGREWGVSGLGPEPHCGGGKGGQLSSVSRVTLDEGHCSEQTSRCSEPQLPRSGIFFTIGEFYSMLKRNEL